jgi:transcriptional regulator with XRE-family HTH domain
VKNYDLVWARERAGWTQDQAARKMDVRRRTFSRWETGAISMPNRKWQAFLRLAQIKEREIPQQRKYDERGFPIGFNKESYDVDDCTDFMREEAGLREIEGEEHAWRARERYRLLITHYYKGRRDSDEKIRRDMAEYDDMAYAYTRAMGDAIEHLTAQGVKEITEDERRTRAVESSCWTKRELFERRVNALRDIQLLEDGGLIIKREGRYLFAREIPA